MTKEYLLKLKEEKETIKIQLQALFQQAVGQIALIDQLIKEIDNIKE